MSRRIIALCMSLGVMALILIGLALLPSTVFGGNIMQIDPTSQQQTISAIVNSYFTQTAVVQKQLDATQTAQAVFDQALTATAGFQGTVNAQFNAALTATATLWTPTPAPTAVLWDTFEAAPEITRTYVGDVSVLFNPANATFLKDSKIELTQHFRTEAVDGHVVLVMEEQTITSKGEVIQWIVNRYAIDRETMEFASQYPDSWSKKEGFWPRQGLVIGWPADTQKKNYLGWNDDYRSTVVLKYGGEEKHGGINTYYFTTNSNPQEIKPEAVAAMNLPMFLPKDLFQVLAEASEVSPVIKAAIPLILSKIEGDSVPLKYYYEYQGEYWVEPETGVLIDTKKHELRKVGLADEVLAAIPVFANMSDEQKAAGRITISDLAYHGTEESIQEAIDLATLLAQHNF